ncbi:MAG TPA: MarR family transcriptional regulator [Planktothrix sp.]
MKALMMTAKLFKRVASVKFSENENLRKLSGPRIGVLFMVQEAGTIRMGDLAGKLMVAPRTVTDFIDGMERDGFLRRVPDPKDRRAMLIELTPEAKERFNEIAEQKHKFMEEVYSVLTVEEQDLLIRLLEKIQRGPLARLAQGGGDCFDLKDEDRL